MLDHERPGYLFAWLTTLLALVAAAGGLLLPGLYRDTVAFVVLGWPINDLVTLVVALPVLVVSLLLARRGSGRAFLVLGGALYYTLYNYAFYLFGAAFNWFFLIYVGLLVFPAYALIQFIGGLDAPGLTRRLDPRTPNKLVSGYMFFWGGLLGVVWVSQAVIFILTDQLPAIVVQTGATTNLVGILDLLLQVAVILPAAIWLWRRRPWGYPLAVVLNVAGALYTIVLTAGSLHQAAAGIPGAADLVPLWVALGLGSLISTVLLLRGLRPSPVANP